MFFFLLILLPFIFNTPFISYSLFLYDYFYFFLCLGCFVIFNFLRVISLIKSTTNNRLFLRVKYTAVMPGRNKKIYQRIGSRQLFHVNISLCYQCYSHNLKSTFLILLSFCLYYFFTLLL